MARPSKPRDDTAEVMVQSFPNHRPTPSLETLCSGTGHAIVVVRERAINLRDNLVRVADGERLDRARDLLNRAIAVALGKD